MPVENRNTLNASVGEKEAIVLFFNASGVRDYLRTLTARFSSLGYLKQHDADAARKYVEGQWKALQAHVHTMPLTFMCHRPAVATLAKIGWADPYADEANGYFRWKPAAFRELVGDGSLEEFLGRAGYAKLWGLIFFGYLRHVFEGMKLDQTISNDRAEDLLVADDRFRERGYGEAFAKEVQRVWAPQQAVTWAASEIPVVMQDLPDSCRVLAAMLVRVYTGVLTNERIRARYGNWRPGMLPVSRLSGIAERD